MRTDCRYVRSVLDWHRGVSRVGVTRAPSGVCNHVTVPAGTVRGQDAAVTTERIPCFATYRYDCIVPGNTLPAHGSEDRKHQKESAGSAPLLPGIIPVTGRAYEHQSSLLRNLAPTIESFTFAQCHTFSLHFQSAVSVPAIHCSHAAKACSPARHWSNLRPTNLLDQVSRRRQNANRPVASQGGELP